MRSAFLKLKALYNRDRIAFMLLLCISLIFLAIQVFYYHSQAGGWEIYLCDTDPHMRLVRVEQLAETGDWYDNVIHRSNAPYGETLHWTRPLDILLLLGAFILKPFLGFHDALGWWGVAISPILGVVSLLALYWAVKPALKENERYLLILLFLAQPLLTMAFNIGRPDHHSLLALIFCILLGCLYRIIGLQDNSKKFSQITGLLAGIGVWISVEFLVAVFWIIATLTLLWIFRGQRYSRRLFDFSLSLFFSTCVFLLAERPLTQIMVQEYDRISVVHVFVFLVVAVCSLIMSRIKATTAGSRTLAAGLAALGGFLVLWHFIPDFFQGPYSQVDPTVARIWLSRVKEVQPMLKVNLVIQVLFIGPLVFSLLFLLWAIIRVKDDESRIYLAPLLVGLPMFAALTFYQIRWIYYSNVFILIGLVLLLNSLFQVIARIQSPFRQRFTRIMIILLFCTGFYVTGVLADNYYGDPDTNSYEVILRPLCEWLNHYPASTILMDQDFGPEILYRTSHSVIATPYHRNTTGILYSYEVMGTPNLDTVHKMLAERNVNLIVLCPQSSESGMFRSQTDEGITFYGRLLAGDIPVWLDKVELPEDLEQDYLIFKVKQ